jgi:EAL domain-containing protein (putative c-di-GMP-specific phosphodiesterase class I)
MTVAIDLPVLSLNEQLGNTILNHLRKCKLPHGWLELDIAEHLLVHSSDAAPLLRQLKAAGVRLAVDDFGSAGASLSTLRNLELDILKIAPSFVRELANDGGTDMAAAIIHLGRALGMRVLAKGVETVPQLTILNSLGCDQYQGELFSSTLQAGAVLALLQAQYTAQYEVQKPDPLTSQAITKPASKTTPRTRGPRR